MSQHTWREFADFVTGFLRNPGRNGSVIPSSPRLTEAMIAGLPWDRIRTLVELGPGVGTFTGAILARVHPETRVILVEVAPLYAAHLEQRYGARATIDRTSAAELEAILARHDLGRPDCIISGLPLASLPPAVSGRIASQIQSQIKRGTIYRSFTYRPGRTRAFFEDGLLDYQSPRIWANVPPAFVLGAR